MMSGRDINTVLNQCKSALDMKCFFINRQNDV